MSQGPVVNSDDLADALEQGEIFGAGLDVITGEPNVGPENRLVQLKNCEFDSISVIHLVVGLELIHQGVVIPHMGSADVDTRKKMAELCKLLSQIPRGLELRHNAKLLGVRNAINGAKGEALLAEVKP